MARLCEDELLQTCGLRLLAAREGARETELEREGLPEGRRRCSACAALLRLRGALMGASAGAVEACLRRRLRLD